jgi:hypothetical protein
VSGKLLSLFRHPEFVRKFQARAERELLESILPVVHLGRGRFRCHRCLLDFDRPTPLRHANDAQACPRCDEPPERDALEAFLARVLRED